MLKNITLGQFFPGDSLLHRLDPRMKILLTMAMIVGAFFVTGFFGYAVLFAYLAVLARLSRIEPRVLLRSLKPILFIIALTFVLNVFAIGGETVWFSFYFLRITREGVMSAIFLSLRLIFLILGSQLLTLTTSPIALTDGLEQLLSPLAKIGFPSHELAMMMSIALRSIPTLLEETDKIMKAQAARGADFESGNLIQKAKAMVPLLVPLFVSAIRRAEELATAMEARCYRVGAKRTRMKTLHYTRLDAYALLVQCGVFALVLAERWLLL